MKSFFLSLLKLAIAVIIVGSLVRGFNRNTWHYQNNQSRTSKIYSLKTQSDVKGVFVLVIGTIGTQDYYVFYRKTESGGLIKEKIKIENCIIYEGYSEPAFKEYGQSGYHLQKGDTVEKGFYRDEYGEYYHELHIPKGYITQHTDIQL